MQQLITYKRLPIKDCLRLPKQWRDWAWSYSKIRKSAKKENPPSINVLWVGVLQALISKNRSFIDNVSKLVQGNISENIILRLTGGALSYIGCRNEGLEKLRQAVDLNPSLENMETLAYYLYVDEKYYESFLLYNRVLKERPKDIYALTGKGLVLIQYNRLAEAEECFQNALEISPKDTDARYGQGEILYNRGEFGSALNEYKKSLKYRISDRYNPWIRIAKCYYFLQNLTKAKKAISKALKIKPDCEYAKHLLEEIAGNAFWGETLLFDGYYEKAYPYLKVEASQEKTPGKAALNLGMVEAILNTNIEFISNAVKDVGSNLAKDILLAYSGITKFEIGFKEEGLAELKQAVELNPTSDNLYILARILGELPEGIEKAKVLYKRILSTEPENFDALYGLAWLTDNDEKALELYKRAAKLDPDNAACHFEIGSILLNQGRYQEAIQEFEKVHSLDNDIPSKASFNIAKCFLEMEDFQKAIKWAKTALFEDPNLVDAEKLLNRANIALEKQGKDN